MNRIRMGIVQRNDSTISNHLKSTDPVDVVVLHSTFLDPPRLAACRSIRTKICGVLPNVDLVPYVWHYISHSPDDGISKIVTRKIAGNLQSTGHLQNSPEVLNAWNIMKDIIREIGASQSVLRTPSSFSTGSLGRKRLKEFIIQRSEEGIQIVWESEGLWTVDMATAFARDVNTPVMASVVNCLGGQQSTWKGATWLRVTQEIKASHAEILAYEIADLAEDTGDFTIVFDGPRALQSLRIFAKAWAQMN